jgi:hypothetical protein
MAFKFRIQDFFRSILQKPSLYLFVFLIIFSIDRHQRLEFNKAPFPGPFFDDVKEYYSFLPVIFTDHAPGENPYYEIKRTIGMAIMYSPAFITGHIIASFTGQVKDGYSEPYQWSFRWENILISLFALWFCRKNLLYFFNETITTIALACIYLGTNLFFYTYSLAGMPHTYLFFLISIFIYFSVKWVFENKSTSLIGMLSIGGLIVLIRPTDIIVFLFPLLLSVRNFTDLKNRFKLFFNKSGISFLGMILFLLPFVFQFMLTKKYTGLWYHNGYGDEHFFFNDPKVMQFLFSFRKGWLLYTPIMIFSLIGVMISAQKLKSFFPFLVTFLCLNIYILSSWWDWGYGGSFGSRVMIEWYAFLIFPFAVFVQWIWTVCSNRKITKYLIRFSALVLFLLLIEFNLFQSKQYQFQLIHWSGMNKKAYMFLFLRSDFSPEEIEYLHTLYSPPERAELINGNRD